MTAPATIPLDDAVAALDSVFWHWGGTVVTYSIAGAGSTWPVYGGGGEPASSGYATLSSTQAQQFRAAMAVWDSLIPLSLVETDDVTATGQIRVAGTATPWWGFAYYPGGGVGGDIWISNTVLASSDFATGSRDFESLLHEIGHALGLKHPFEDGATLPAAYDNYRYSIMSYTAPPEWVITFSPGEGGGISWSYESVTLVTPGMFDILAIQDIYGRDTTTRAGSTTYTFDAASPVVQVIHDAGGADTFDLSAQTRPSDLDLREGAFSSVNIYAAAARIEDEVARFGEWARGSITNVLSGPGVYEWRDNVGIAYGTVIEHARLGSGHDRALGNGAANRLTGGDGNDSLAGAGGRDTLEGGAGNDTLDGGAGDDRLVGGAGNDRYVVNSALDIVVEATGGGVDTVETTLLSIAAPAAVEVLRAAGAGGSSLAGNGLGNTITGGGYADTLNGGDGNDLLQGAGANDRLSGGSGNDTLGGNAGHDSMFGGIGNDRLSGFEGNDRMFGDAGNDTLLGGTGNDVLFGQDGTDLLSGEAGADALDGGPGADKLNGGDANDVLTGGAGADTLTGGLGSDAFRFLAPADGGDVVADFAAAQADRIVLLGSAFGIAAGTQLTAGQDFVTDAAPGTAAPSLLYASATGALHFDADGSGAGGAVLLATLSGAPALGAGSIVFV